MTTDLQQETTDVLQRLLRFDTVNPPGNERPAIEYLAGYLEDVGFECTLLALDDARPNLVAPCAGASPGPTSATSATSTPCSRRPRSGRTTRGRATSPTGICGGAARST